MEYLIFTFINSKVPKEIRNYCNFDKRLKFYVKLYKNSSLNSKINL